MLVEQIGQPVVPQSPPLHGGKERIGGLAFTFSQPLPQHGDRLFTERRASCLGAFGHSPPMGPGAPHRMPAAEANAFCATQSRLHRPGPPAAIPPPAPAWEVPPPEQ